MLIGFDSYLQYQGSNVELDVLRPSTWDHALTLLSGVSLLLGGPIAAMLIIRAKSS